MPLAQQPGLWSKLQVQKEIEDQPPVTSHARLPTPTFTPLLYHTPTVTHPIRPHSRPHYLYMMYPPTAIATIRPPFCLTHAHHSRTYTQQSYSNTDMHI
ncbi:hypothetical protein Pmani_005793 [Petrolisthes manimaculis]|uniref:Uncharacterized protein n=1 Tax=Petrolisthes manimaculis TaxID=1843537 RepID=A0AAE1QC83_9EUCA|nr:hypothetical protein Pmani_005793 [Petrolisthes manimaculis]